MMLARSSRLRATNVGSPVPLTFSQRKAPLRSAAFAGASVTSTVLSLSAPARSGEALSWRQMPYSVMSTFAEECFSNCHCSSGFSL